MWEELALDIARSLDRLGSTLTEWASEHLFNILVILFSAYLLRKFGTRIISSLLEHTLRRDLFATDLDRKKRVKTLEGLVGATLRVGIWIIATIMIISELGVNTAPLLASAGILGVALGFGAQSLIKDFVSGFFIITENQYRVGDVVRLDKVSGVVESITIRTTVLRDLDGNVHHVPNGVISVTTNMTLGYAQVNEDIQVGFDTDIAQLEHLINHVGEQIAAMPQFKDKILEPPHFERVDKFNDVGIVVKILSKTAPSEQWNVKGQLYKSLKKAFDQHGIELPYPQIGVHSKSPASKQK